MNDPRFILYDGMTINTDLFRSAHAVGEAVIVQYFVTLKEVKRKDLARLKTMLDSFTQTGVITRGSLLLTFDGWNFDNRVLAEIPEVREYIKQVVGFCPHIWYFLIPQLCQHMFVSLVDYTMVSSNAQRYRVADGSPQLNENLVQLDMITASKCLSELVRAVKAYGTVIEDAEGAREVITEWRRILNL